MLALILTYIKATVSAQQALQLAKAKGVPVPVILNTGRWINEKTFANFYDKPIEQNLSKTILETTVM